jgi:hypothetical protein
VEFVEFVDVGWGRAARSVLLCVLIGVHLFATYLCSAEKALLEECGLTVSDLQSLLMAHQDNRLVQQVFMEMQASVAHYCGGGSYGLTRDPARLLLQIQNQKILMKHGIRMQ